MAAYTERQLAETLGTVWDLLKKHLSEDEKDKLVQQSGILEELEEFGVGGPVGLGLGRYGGHAV